MKNILISGSSGMIGGLILERCLNRQDVNKVTSIVRKKSGNNHSKLVEIVHQNFLDYNAIISAFKNQDICFYCIGVYTGQVDKDEFYSITVDYTKAFCEALKANSPGAAFCFLSGQGADQSEKSRIMFARDKGIAENIIMRMNFSHTHIFRPGYIYPVTPRKEPNIFYSFMRFIYIPALARPFKNASVTSEELANVMVDAGFNNPDKIIFENRDIRVYNTLASANS